MSDDTRKSQPGLYDQCSRSFARFTHFVDEHIRIIQYGVYCIGTAGLVIVLHSVRAFTKFNGIKDIPKDFITKHVRLHGHVRWVGTTHPSLSTSKSSVPLLSLPKSQEVSEIPKEDGVHPTSGSEVTTDGENMEIETTSDDKAKHKSLSADNRGIYEYGAGELHPWESGIDPDVNRIEYDEELLPLYMQVEHTPVISLSKKWSRSLLPLQLADVEVSRVGFQLLQKELLDKRAWFTLVSHNSEDDTLITWVRPAKFFHRKSINYRLVFEGLALTGPMNLDLHNDKQYVKKYMKLLKAQEHAEKKKLGLWKPPPQHSINPGIFRRIFAKLRAIVSKKR
ncbi:hypothetical protein SK128_020879 [Halocaridina rubra]|uniref:TNase-like domain-containing protein n=1 Tax=Halocaridina rubra TaxID=373956 RepID=A0AAN8ZXF0_HALRR